MNETLVEGMTWKCLEAAIALRGVVEKLLKLFPEPFLDFRAPQVVGVTDCQPVDEVEVTVSNGRVFAKSLPKHHAVEIGREEVPDAPGVCLLVGVENKVLRVGVASVRPVRKLEFATDRDLVLPLVEDEIEPFGLPFHPG